jgi:hypothetical protein
VPVFGARQRERGLGTRSVKELARRRKRLEMARKMLNRS